MGEGSPWVPFNFLALPDEQSRLDSARVVVLPVPYDSTTSYKSGAREGPRAIIDASANLEDYDPELDADVAEVGIHTTPWLEAHMAGPSRMIDRVYEAVQTFIAAGKLVALLGGEHSVSVGHVRALVERYPDLSVLYLDAHADLRDEYMGTPWGHASAARRVSEICPVVQVGVRCLSQDESEYIRAGKVSTFFWPPPAGDGVNPAFGPLRTSDVIGLLSKNVYVSIDLDVLDPAIMAAVGTPEPGGMDWYQVTSLLRAVAEERRIVGFDVTELSPSQGPVACAYTAAKLVYKLVAYSTLLPTPGTGERSDGRVSPLAAPEGGQWPV